MKITELKKGNIFRFPNESQPLIVVDDELRVAYLEDYARWVVAKQYNLMPWPIEPDTEIVKLF